MFTLHVSLNRQVVRQSYPLSYFDAFYILNINVQCQSNSSDIYCQYPLLRALVYLSIYIMDWDFGST